MRADLSPLAGSAQSKQGKNGKTYWTIVFNIEIHFGLTEFRARIKWVDNVSRLRIGVEPAYHVLMHSINSRERLSSTFVVEGLALILD